MPIGWVHSPLRRRDEAPKQGYEGAPEARIRIEPAFRPGLDRLEPGGHLLVLTWLHEAERDVLVVHPRDDPGQPLTGVFATRLADRPNPLGIHGAALLAVERAGTLVVRGLVAIDGTPVLDLKPVLPIEDRGPGR